MRGPPRHELEMRDTPTAATRLRRGASRTKGAGRTQRPRVWPESEWADQEGAEASRERPPRPQAPRLTPAKGRARGPSACISGGLAGAGDWLGQGRCWCESTWLWSLWSEVQGHLLCTAAPACPRALSASRRMSGLGKHGHPDGWAGGAGSHPGHIGRPRARGLSPGGNTGNGPLPGGAQPRAQTPPPAREGQAQRRLSTVSLLPRETMEPSLFTLIKLVTGFWQIGNKSTRSS